MYFWISWLFQHISFLSVFLFTLSRSKQRLCVETCIYDLFTLKQCPCVWSWCVHTIFTVCPAYNKFLGEVGHTVASKVFVVYLKYFFNIMIYMCWFIHSQEMHSSFYLTSIYINLTPCFICRLSHVSLLLSKIVTCNKLIKTPLINT